MNAKRMRNYYDMFAIMFNSQKSYRKYIENTHLGLLTETHEYYFGSLKHQIFIYSRWRHPPKTVSPRPYCRSRRGRNGLVSETNRPIALSSITSKVFEHIILLRLEEYLWTTDNQFGFKSGHSTDLCIYALSELIEYFKSRSTSVYVAFLDASKAFDKISHWTLFRKLIDRNVPMYLIKVLCYWYEHQLMSVRWGYSISNVLM